MLNEDDVLILDNFKRLYDKVSNILHIKKNIVSLEILWKKYIELLNQIEQSLTISVHYLADQYYAFNVEMIYMQLLNEIDSLSEFIKVQYYKNKEYAKEINKKYKVIHASSYNNWLRELRNSLVHEDKLLFGFLQSFIGSNQSITPSCDYSLIAHICSKNTHLYFIDKCVFLLMSIEQGINLNLNDIEYLNSEILSRTKLNISYKELLYNHFLLNALLKDKKFILYDFNAWKHENKDPFGQFYFAIGNLISSLYNDYITYFKEVYQIVCSKNNSLMKDFIFHQKIWENLSVSKSGDILPYYSINFSLEWQEPLF